MAKRLLKLQATLLAVVSALGSLPAHAREVQMPPAVSGPKSAIVAYDQAVKALKAGDVVTFPGGKKFKLGEKLGEGKTTQIFAIEGDPHSVLRIPSFSGPAEGAEFHIQEYLAVTAHAYPKLKAAGVPVPELKEYVEDQFIVMERVGKNGMVGLDQFLSATPPLPGSEEMAKKLVEFGRQTAVFTHLGDFHEGQLGYDLERKQWVLYDWGDLHKVLNLESLRTRTEPQTLLTRKLLLKDTIFGELLGTYRRGWMLSSNLEKISDFAGAVLLEVEDGIRRERMKLSGLPLSLLPKSARTSCSAAILKTLGQ